MVSPLIEDRSIFTSTFMFQDLKALLTNIKTEFEDLQSKFQTDLRELGKFFSTLRE